MITPPKSSLLLLAAAGFALLPAAYAEGPPPVLLRGPYLQMPNPTAVTVCWRTDLSGKGTVRFGMEPKELQDAAVEAVEAVDHEVRLTGLRPATKYYYSVRTDDGTLAEGESFFFYTPPVEGSSDTIRFWALGDCGTASVAQQQVRDAFAPLHAQRRADMILMLGDNAYYSGMDSQYQAAIFNMYPEYLKQVPVWSCIGNHETYNGQDERGLFTHDHVFVFPTEAECGGVASGTERYFSWNYGKVHFISLDSMTSNRESDGPMAEWLNTDLLANTQPWVVAFWHHPPYTRGSHNSDWEFELIEMRQNILPILEAHGVDLVLCGHSHCYERSYLLDGHYGLSSTLTSAHRKNPGNGQEDSDGPYFKAATGMAPHQGAVYVVAGSSGQTSGGLLDHPAHYISLNRLGSLVVDVSGTRMDVKFLREAAVQGAAPVFDDYFSIIKGVTPPPLPLVTRGPYLQKASPTAMTVRWRTDIPAAGRVRYGTSLAALSQHVNEPAPAGTEHSVRLTGLLPDTKYFYRVESNGTPALGGPGYFFRTPPAPGAAAPVRIWALGDAGKSGVEQRAVRDSFIWIQQQRNPDIWLMLGNNAAASGTDAEYQSAFFDTFGAWMQQIPLWSCIGEQETLGPAVNGKFAWDDIFDFPAAGESGGMPSGTERYYSWDHANIHFVALDSVTSSRTANGPMAQWLNADLEANTLPWTIAFWHHPPYSKGSHNSDTETQSSEMRQNILPILEQKGVDLVLCAHSESYERSFLLDEHYGSSSGFLPANKLNNRDGREGGTGVYVKPADGSAPHAGAVYVVAGSASQTGGGPLNHPAHFLSLNQLGSIVVDVLDKRMDVRFLRESEEPGGSPPRYDDYFTILKGGPIVPAAATGLAVLPVDETQALLYWQDNSLEEERYEVQLALQGGNYENAAYLPPGVTGCTLTGLTPGAQYSVITIASNIAGTAPSAPLSFQQPFDPGPVSAIEQWRFLHWGVTSAAGDRADMADPDRDGSVNLIEYALGSLPTDAHSVPWLTAGRTEEKLTLSFPRLAAPELTYTVEFSSGLNPGAWVPAFTSSGAANVAGMVTVVDPAHVPGARRFARLKVTLN
ncbi:MAG TPA: metallophosphoesterase [Verrucomicrobiales bacterium]|nr:metallophosphoesterase [Verrucomicrobiales bacterium]